MLVHHSKIRYDSREPGQVVWTRECHVLIVCSYSSLYVGLSVEASYDMISRFHESFFTVSRLGFMVLTTRLLYIEHCTRESMIQDCVT